MVELSALPTLEFPSIPVPPGFDRIVRSGDTPEPAEPPSLFDFSPILPGWYPFGMLDIAGNTPPVSSVFSLIACTVPGVSELCLSSSSPMLSDTPDRDAGLWTGLPSPPPFRPRPSRVVSSDAPPPVPWTVRPVMHRSVRRVMFRAGGWPRRALSCQRFCLRT